MVKVYLATLLGKAACRVSWNWLLFKLHIRV